MYEKLKENYSSHSTENIQLGKKKNIGITIDKNLKEKYKMRDSKTLPYFSTTNNQNLHNKNSFLKNKKNQILEYNTKYKTLEPDVDLVNIDNDDAPDQKKKVGKKVNRNLKLLNIIKERMNKEKNKISENNKANKEEKNVDMNIKENINRDIQQKEKEKFNVRKLGDEKEKKVEKKVIDEEKKNKLLNIINSKKFNKFQRKEGKDEQKESKEKDNYNNNSNNKIINNKIKKILNQSQSSRPYNNLYKKETGSESDTFSIRTSRQNEKGKLDYNEEQILYDDNNNLVDKEKLNIKTQKNKIEKRKKEAPTINDIINNKEKGVNKNSVINNKNNNPSSKKGALKIVELLKMKKKEENENTRAKTQEKQIIDSEENNEKMELKKITKSIISENRQNLKKEALPSKNFREEDENENNYDSHNRTQQYFRDPKKLNNNSKINLNISDIDDKKKKYFNINKNRVIKQITINNNIYNNFLNNSKNLQKIERVNYHNPIGIKSKLKQRLKKFNAMTDKMLTDINNSINKNNNTNIESVNLNNKSNIRTLDNSIDTMKPNKNELSKTMINNNNNSMKKHIYKPKRISSNNSPQRLNPYERNKKYIMNTKNNNLNMDSNIPKKPANAYVKKSPGRIQDYYDDSFHNNNLNANYENKTLYNKKTKKLIKNSVIDKNNFNNSYNNLGDDPNNILGVEFSSANGLNSSVDTYSTNRFDSINVNNNNYYNFNNNNNISKNNNIKSMRQQRRPNNFSVIFNLEDLLILEERLNDIGMALENKENFENKCFNFWNYFYNCSLPYLIEKLFKSKEDSNMVRLSINYQLISIMVCYEYSFDIDASSQDIYLLLLELIDLNHNNLIVISEYILTKIVPENKQNIWVLQLKEIIKNSKITENNKYYKNIYFQGFSEKINFNTNLIIKKLKNILLNYPTELSDILITLLKNIDTKTYEEINDFFKEFILRIDNFEGSIIASSYLKKNKNFKSLPAPYLKFPPSKPYTLVLDLDETLVYFKIKSSKGGTLRARPYLFGFLEEMGHYYELIIWTSATEAYANSLIDAVEYEKKYFDYVLYREHAVIVEDDFVKDLTRIGRGLDRTIIIDDMPQNFRLQKENGITIKPFLGNNLDDSALYELVPILKHIAESGKDVRIGLNKYRKEIIEKVTSNISKQKI
mgnify:CR=1 FL=1